MTDRLTDNDAAWGKSRAQYASESHRQRRDAERARRERNRAELAARREDPHAAVYVPIGDVREQEDDWHLRLETKDGPRTVTQHLAGDPLPGRSALDRRTT